MKRRIALTGSAGSGKSTIARILEHTYGYKRLSFAHPLKRLVGELFGVETVTKTPYVRRLLQDVGLMLREIDENVWIYLMDISIQNIPPTQPIVIDDLRFENEAAWARRNGFYVVRLERASPLPADLASHVSEAGIPFDYIDYKPYTPDLESLIRETNYLVTGEIIK